MDAVQENPMEYLDKLFKMWLQFCNHCIEDEMFTALLWAFVLTCTVLFFMRFMKEVFG